MSQVAREKSGALCSCLEWAVEPLALLLYNGDTFLPLVALDFTSSKGLSLL